MPVKVDNYLARPIEEVYCSRCEGLGNVVDRETDEIIKCPVCGGSGVLQK